MEICVNGITLFYEKHGKGAPLILLHGNGEDHHIFDKLSEKLQNNFTLYAIDSRNHGKSEKTDDFSYETMTEDIFAFCTALSIEKAYFLGFSDGAIISLLLALTHPEKIKKMALLGVNLSPSDFTEENMAFIQDMYEKTKDPLFYLMTKEPNIDILRLKEIVLPTLLIAAENDLFRPELYPELEEAFPNASLLIMEGHEHDSYIIENDMLYPDLISFFEKR